MKSIFGSNDNNGTYRFFQANLLALPLRSNIKPYFLCISDEILRGLKSSVENFIGDKKPALQEAIDTALKAIEKQAGNNFLIDSSCNNSAKERIEDYNVKKIQGESAADGISKIFCNSNGDGLNAFIALSGHKVLKDYAKNLPVIARNHLDNGQSENLWYEEVVPRYSMFYFFIGVPKEDENFEEFNRILKGNIVQIGANATIGYGYCKISEILL